MAAFRVITLSQPQGCLAAQRPPAGARTPAGAPPARHPRRGRRGAMLAAMRRSRGRCAPPAPQRRPDPRWRSGRERAFQAGLRGCAGLGGAGWARGRVREAGAWREPVVQRAPGGSSALRAREPERLYEDLAFALDGRRERRALASVRAAFQVGSVGAAGWGSQPRCGPAPTARSGDPGVVDPCHRAVARKRIDLIELPVGVAAAGLRAKWMTGSGPGYPQGAAGSRWRDPPSRCTRPDRSVGGACSSAAGRAAR